MKTFEQDLSRTLRLMPYTFEMEPQELIDWIKRLPPERVAKVAEFIESLEYGGHDLDRTDLHRALTDYAIHHAGVNADPDPDLESVKIDLLRQQIAA
jgi:hypothetical protein